jgi:hypothetical protein
MNNDRFQSLIIPLGLCMISVMYLFYSGLSYSTFAFLTFAFATLISCLLSPAKDDNLIVALGYSIIDPVYFSKILFTRKYFADKVFCVFIASALLFDIRLLPFVAFAYLVFQLIIKLKTRNKKL